MAATAKVLVIDDDPDMLSTTQLFLQKRGFDVLTAADPDEGLREVEHAKPDVVILDIMMPRGTEGLHWLWKVRRHPDPQVREVPIVIASSIHSTTSIRLHEGDADESGEYLPVQGFYDKPVDPDVLAEKITAVLGTPK